MECKSCGTVVNLRSEFCPNCGERVVVSMDDIVTTSHNAAAYRHGEELNGKLRSGIVVLLFVFMVVIGFIYLNDRKVGFDGSAMPSIPANAVYGGSTSADSIQKPYTDPRPLPPIPPPVVRALGYRADKTIRGALRVANGGAALEIEKTIDRGLHFLEKYQDAKDGSWPVAMIQSNAPQDATNDFKWGKIGVTSLALLAFFGDGHHWVPDATGARDMYSGTIRRGVRYLIGTQNPENGRMGPIEGHFMYNHAMATLALAEATALSGDPELKAHLDKAVEYIVKTQTERGGWDYYGATKSEIDDISVSAWVVQALYAAREAGAKVPSETFEHARSFYTALTKGDRGVYNFQLDDGLFIPARAGMVLMMRQLVGDSSTLPEIRTLSSKLIASIPKTKMEWGRSWRSNAKEAPERAKIDPYMFYFCSYGMFFLGGKEWEEWNPKAIKAILTMQDVDGAWRTNDIYSQQGGTIYSTALFVMSLQVHHRIIHSVASKPVDNSKDE